MQTTKLILFYFCKDFELASILYASGQVLDGTEWRESACYFRFEDSVRCSEIILAYDKNELKLNAKTLIEAIRTIKSIIYRNKP